MHNHIVSHHISGEIQLQAQSSQGHITQQAVKIVFSYFFREKPGKSFITQSKEKAWREKLFANIYFAFPLRKLVNECRSNKMLEFIHFQSRRVFVEDFLRKLRLMEGVVVVVVKSNNHDSSMQIKILLTKFLNSIFWEFSVFTLGRVLVFLEHKTSHVLAQYWLSYWFDY